VLVLRDPTPEELEAAGSKGKEEDGGEKPAAAAKKSKAQLPWVIDRLYFKEDTVGYLDRRRTHLYVFKVASKAMKQVSSGDYDDTEPAWSPDGKLLAFSANRSKRDPDATYACRRETTQNRPHPESCR
jgi:dipeptidyl aminopeptidase/acylaminoacyl peptidase